MAQKRNLATAAYTLPHDLKADVEALARRLSVSEERPVTASEIARTALAAYVKKRQQREAASVV